MRFARSRFCRTIVLDGVIGALLCLTACSAIAGVSAVDAIAAEIMEPISVIAIDSNTLEFGQIIAGTAGTVVVSPDGGRTCSAGMQVIPNSKTSASVFEVRGTANKSFSISLPTVAIITNGTDSMVVDTFICEPATTSVLDDAGLRLLRVGGTLHVRAEQRVGAYQGSFTVTVAYN